MVSEDASTVVAVAGGNDTAHVTPTARSPSPSRRFAHGERGKGDLTPRVLATGGVALYS